MDSVSNLLDLEKLAAAILFDIVEQDARFVQLSGPSGTGKSSLVKNELSALAYKSGCKLLYFSGDEQRSSVPYGPFASQLNRAKEARTDVESRELGLAKVADGMTPLRIFSGLVGYLKGRQRFSPTIDHPGWGSEEIAILGLLKSVCTKEATIVVLDNFLWFDKYSLKLIDELLSNRYNGDLDFLNRLRVVVILTDEHRLRSPSAAAIDLVSGHPANRHELHKLERPQVLEAMRLFGYQVHLSTEELDLLHMVSLGNLEVLKILSVYLNMGFSVDKTLKEADEFLLQSVYRRLLGSGGKIDWNVALEGLGELSFLGESFHTDQAICLTSDAEFAAEALSQAIQANIVEYNDDGIYRFTHETHRLLLAKNLAGKESEVHSRVYRCLKKMQPTAHALMAHHLVKCGEIEEGVIHLAISYIRLLQELKDPVQYVPIDDLTLIRESECFETIRVFDKAYRLFNQNMFMAAIDMLDQVDLGAPEIILVERDYLVCLCKMELHNRTASREALDLLVSWEFLLEKGEIEAWARIAALSIQCLVLLGQISEARSREVLLSQTLRNNAKSDPKLLHILFVLNRKAAAIKSPPVALRAISKSVAFFSGQQGDREPVNIIELYRSQVNRAACLINNGLYQAAFEQCSEVTTLLEKYSYVDFPRLDLLMNNAVIAAFRSGLITAGQAIKQQSEVIDSQHCTEDDHIHRCNLIALQILSGHLTDARESLSSLELEIEKKQISEIYIIYNFLSNKLAIRIAENDEHGFRETLNLLASVLSDTELPAKSLINRRLSLMGDSYDELKKLPLQALDYHFHRSNLEGDPWKFYGSITALCELQFWASV